MVNCHARSKPREVGTRVAVPSAGWPASNAKIVASPKHRRGSRVISVRRFEFFQPIAVLAAARYWGRSDRILALVAEYLERFIEDRSQLREDRAATNAPAFVMLDLWLRDAHPIHFPIDVIQP